MRRRSFVGWWAVVAALVFAVAGPGAVVQAHSRTANQAAPTVRTNTVCGQLTANTVSTGGTTFQVGTLSFTLAAGATFSGANLSTLAVGSNACFHVTFNTGGQVSHLGIASLTSPLNGTRVCGRIVSFQPSTSTAAGSLTIGGLQLPVVQGTTVTDQNRLVQGRTACLLVQLNTQGQITQGTVKSVSKPSTGGAGGSRPGWGCGDKNHQHSGPPGKGRSHGSPCNKHS